MSRSPSACLARLLIGLSVLLPACGGGGGGGGAVPVNPGGGNGGGGGGEKLDPNKQFFLVGASFARAITTVDGNLDPVQPLVNPASLFETDPLTGVVLPGFPKVLVPGSSLADLATFSFDQILDPLTPQVPLVPRNAAVVLEFSQAVDMASLKLDDSDPARQGVITPVSTIQVLTAEGGRADAQVQLDPTSPKRLVLLGLSTTGGVASWEPSPLLFDTHGNAVENPTGHLRILLDAAGGGMSSAGAKSLTPRPDEIGTPALPLPFNPGNSQLDAIVIQSDSVKTGFNGFLPDLTAPRIVRAVRLDGSVTSLSGDELRDTSLPTPPNVTANGGLGEWANGLLEITSSSGPGGVLTTQYVVSTNFTENGGATSVFRIAPGKAFDPAVKPGDSYTLTRTEFFEPVPPPLPTDATELARVTVDPVNHPRDPDDPQDAFNSDLRYFARMFDENGVERTDVWDPSTHTFLPIPPRTSVRLFFSEAMDGASFLPYESFFVTDATVPVSDPGFRNMRIGQTKASADGRSVSFNPVLEDQFQGTNSFIGFGGTSAALRLVLRSLPETDAVQSLEESATPSVQAQLVDTGTLGVVGATDLGGRGLGLPAALLDQSDPLNFLLVDGSPGRGAFAPAVDFSFEFETLASADPDYGAVVHRFMGQASTALISYPEGTVHDEVSQGIEYTDFAPLDEDGDGTIDRRFIYGPTLLEVGLNVPGHLTGASAATIEHLIDNFNKPKRSSFASPNGEDFLISVGFGLGLPINSGFGTRFQHVFRAGDASPSESTFRGAILDLVGLAWSPFGNIISNTKLDGMEILVGLSGVNSGFGPNTNQTNGIPTDDGSGLVNHFDCNKLEWLDNCISNPDLKPIGNLDLKAAKDGQPPMANVVKSGTPYLINAANLFAPANAANSTSGFNLYLDYPTFNAGLDPVFGKNNVFSYPYDSTFPMLIEYQVAPNEAVPSALNLYRFSPGILSSALPRFRVWSQGQDPTAHCVPNWTLNVGAGPYGGNQKKWFRGGEGGPLIEPGTLSQPLAPPAKNNGMPTIPADAYVLPPYVGTDIHQPEPDWVKGEIDADDGTPNPNPTAGCITKFPTCNSDPYMNWYFANGMLMYPLPNFTAYPGPAGLPPTIWYGYGVPAAAVAGVFGTLFVNQVPPCIIPGSLGGSNQISIPPVLSNEPGMSSPPAVFGDNSRYYMMWKYQKRVSIIESPTILAEPPSVGVHYLRPIVDPPLAAIDPNASILVEFKAGSLLDFAVPALDSGYVDVLDPSFEEDLSGPGDGRNFVKFRVSFGVAKGQTQSPSINTIVIPYKKVSP